ncbi:hypothetical protein Tco_0444150, partial [Tanacetum coccineum]
WYSANLLPFLRHLSVSWGGYGSCGGCGYGCSGGGCGGGGGGGGGGDCGCVCYCEKIVVGVVEIVEIIIDLVVVEENMI